MAQTYVDGEGRRITLGSQIGVGGEGAVYELANTKNWVAKIYKNAATGIKAEKLRGMTQISAPDLNKIAAFPKSTIHSGICHDVAGVILPRINAHEIHELYSPVERKTKFPNADWRFLVRAATNTAIAFATLHRHKIVIGDVNQGNIFVGKDATVKFIDCDSFQFQINGKSYLCEVGVPHFTPPELQQSDFSLIPRSVNHDGFGLAVLIFHLLFMGRHPFAGRFQVSYDMPIERAISEKRFPYSLKTRATMGEPPPNALTMHHVSSELGTLFERAFLTEHRPLADEWARRLSRFERSLTKCSRDRGHYYSQYFKRCHWCDLESQGGHSYFLSVSLATTSTVAIEDEISRIWARIHKLPSPDKSINNTINKLPGKSHLSTMARSLPSYPPRNDFQLALFMISILSLGLSFLGLLWQPIAYFTLLSFLVFLIWSLLLWLVSYFSHSEKVMRESRNKLIHDILMAYDDLEALRLNPSTKYTKINSDLLNLKQSIDRIPRQKAEEYELLKVGSLQVQMHEFLNKQLIRNASITGIGRARVSTLRSYGIETALDVVKFGVSNVPSIGSAISESLADWVNDLRENFNYQPHRGIPPSKHQEIELKYRRILMDSLKKMRSSFSELVSEHRKAALDISLIEDKIEQLHTAIRDEWSKYKA